jgi:hypothetical protein
LELVTPKKIAGFCANIFDKFCVKSNRLVIENDSPSDRFYLQGGKSAIAVGSNGQKIPVVLMMNDIWLHFSIQYRRVNLNKGKSHEIEGLTLQFYQENNDVKTLLFRAEWDNSDPNEFFHPQPHWHLHPEIKYMIDGESFNAETFKDYAELVKNEDSFASEILNAEKEEKSTLSSFHFAMACLWYSNITDKARVPLTEQNLLNWLTGCLENINLQIKYAYSY